jgi:Zn-dependent protease with chaperone function
MKFNALFQRIVVTAILIGVVTALGASPVFPRQPKAAMSQSDAEVEYILKQVRNKTLDDCFKMMERWRPQAVTPAEKAALLKDGFVLINKKTGAEAALTFEKDPGKLAELYRQTKGVLEVHNRAGIVEYLLFKNDEPIVMTKVGAYIAISSRLLKLVNEGEGRAGIMSHELSHEYFQIKFIEALNSRDCATLRKIELFCDVLAAVTMMKLKMNPDNYAEALQKIVHNSKESEELNDGTQTMPSLAARLKVISAIKKQFSH